MISLWNGARRGALVATCALALAACSDDDNGDTSGQPDGSTTLDSGVDAFVPGIDSSTPDGGVDSGVTTPPAPTQFVFATAITVNSVSTGYIQATNDIDSNVKADIRKTIEAPGYGDLWVVGDKAYVTDDSTILRKYT